MTRNWNRSQSITLLATVLFLLATLLPFIILSFYSSPLTDDFSYATMAKEFGIFGSQKRWYTLWTGRYTSSFLISINPLYWEWKLGEILMPLVILLFFVFAFYYLILSFKIFDTRASLLIFVSTVAVYLSNMHTIGEAFYWMAGAYTYTFGSAALMLTWGFILRTYLSKNIITFKDYFILALLLFVIQGTNELIIFYNGYLAFWLLAHSYFKKKKMLRLTSFIFILSLLFALTSLLAPGNFSRQVVASDQGINILMAIYSAFVLSIKKWTIIYLTDKHLILLFAFMLLYIFRKRLVSLNINKLETHPAIVFVVFYVGYIVTFLPGTIAGIGNYGRTLNFTLLTFLFTVVISVVYTIIYFRQRKPEFKVNISKYAVLFMFIGLAFATLGFSNITKAYKDIFSGRAICYKEELDKRHSYLAGIRRTSKVIVVPLHCRPASMNLEDVSKDFTSWMNGGYQGYYKIDTVYSTH